mmetsp:Transcript_128989/g.413171  ORF Transcript_128989/g.413171 Transcript_128989/m.413171 type:complete len:203 (+) Transcript_128989:1096-1704(+)
MGHGQRLPPPDGEIEESTSVDGKQPSTTRPLEPKVSSLRGDGCQAAFVQRHARRRQDAPGQVQGRGAGHTQRARARPDGAESRSGETRDPHMDSVWLKGNRPGLFRIVGPQLAHQRRDLGQHPWALIRGVVVAEPSQSPGRGGPGPAASPPLFRRPRPRGLSRRRAARRRRAASTPPQALRESLGAEAAGRRRPASCSRPRE